MAWGGPGGSAHDAIAKCINTSLGLSRFSSLVGFRLQFAKTGDKDILSVNVDLHLPPQCAPKHKSPSTRARDAARSQKRKDRLHSSNVAAVNQPKPSSTTQAGSSIGQSSELPAPSSSFSAVPNASGASKAGHVAAISARSMPARHEAVNPPLLAPSSSSPAPMALVSPQSANSSPTKEQKSQPTSGTRFELIQAPAQVPVPTRSLSSSSDPATPPRLPPSSGRPPRPTAPPPDPSSSPVERPQSSFWRGLRAAVSTARENR